MEPSMCLQAVEAINRILSVAAMKTNNAWLATYSNTFSLTWINTTALELRRGELVKKLDVPGDVFVDDVALRRFIGANAGSQYPVRAGMAKHLVPAIVQLSREFPTHRHYNFMGWMHLDSR
jgi:hypothetical protein